jgi:hypothetical protein
MGRRSEGRNAGEASATRAQRVRHALRNAGYFAGKELTSDWTTYNFVEWAQVLSPYREREVRVLEIGSYEGRSALFFLNYLPRCRIICVDRFDENCTPERAREMAAVERRFDANLAPFASRCEKRKGQSAEMLPKLALEGYHFDLIYIDGDHRAAVVYLDAALSWPLLVANGLMIFDDYQWQHKSAIDRRPQHGIDAFLASMTGKYRELRRGYQIVIEKL